MFSGGLIDGIPTNKVFTYDWNLRDWVDFAPLNQPYYDHRCACSGSGSAVVIKERRMSEVLYTGGTSDIWQQKDDNNFGVDEFDGGNLLPFDFHDRQIYGFINIAHHGPDDWMLYNGTTWVRGWYPINPDIKVADWQLIIPSDFLQDCDPVD